MLNIKKVDILYESVVGIKAKRSIGFVVVAEDKNGNEVKYNYYYGEVFSLESALEKGIIVSPRTYEIVDAIGVVYFPTTKKIGYLHSNDEVISNPVELEAKYNTFNYRLENQGKIDLDSEDSLLELMDYSYVRQRISER